MSAQVSGRGRSASGVAPKCAAASATVTATIMATASTTREPRENEADASAAAPSENASSNSSKRSGAAAAATTSGVRRPWPAGCRAKDPTAHRVSRGAFGPNAISARVPEEHRRAEAFAPTTAWAVGLHEKTRPEVFNIGTGRLRRLARCVS